MAAAIKAKDEGNRLFKQSRPLEAAKHYAIAEAHAPNDPIYPSNLSAALYELGDYRGCVEAILRSWKNLPADSNPNLARRLATRLSRALCQCAQSGAALPSGDDFRKAVMEMEEISAMAQVGVEPSGGLSWGDWRWTEEIMEAGPRAAHEARFRLASLPIFRHPAVPGYEYYSIGHDDPISLVDDWGNDAKYALPLPLRNMSDKQLSNLAFLFGGVGDARNVFGTVIGLARAYRTLSKQKKERLFAHITMLDIHSHSLARDLCMILLIQDYLDEEQACNNQTVKTEILATMMYIFVGPVMPDYCYKRLHDIFDRLKARLEQDETDLTPWLHVDSASIPAIIRALSFWKTDASTRTTEGMLGAHDPLNHVKQSLHMLDDPSVDPTYKAIVHQNLQQQRKMAQDAVDQRVDLPRPGPNASAAEKREYKKIRDEMVEVLLEVMMKNAGNMFVETLWYEKTKAYLPPTELWSRHPGFDKYRTMQMYEKDPGRNIPFDKINSHISKTWKPNTSLFDDNGFPYPELCFDAFEVPRAILTFNKRFKINSTNDYEYPDSPVFRHFSDFFGALIEAVKVLTSGSGGHLRLEVICGELMQTLSHMSLRSDDTRPEEYPRTFTRSYLSNIPDYTHGVLNTIVYALPCLQRGSGYAVGANSLLNNGMWKDDEEFIYTYTLLRSADIPRFLGCRFDDKACLHGVALLSNIALPRPLTELASRDELLSWLTRVMVYTMLPGTSGTNNRFRVRMPNNLAAFFGLLVYLTRVGFPAHWISDFLQAVLTGVIATDISPFLGQWPIPITDAHRRVPKRAVHLDPWLPDFENVLALSRPGLPFAVALPRTFAQSPSDIGMYEVTEALPWTPAMTMFGNSSVHDTSVVLLFFKESVYQGPSAKIIEALPKMFEGTAWPPIGSVYVLTSVEKFAPPEVRFRMSKARVKKMKQEGWAMIGYRTDNRMAVTLPVKAYRWTEVMSTR